MNKFCLVGENSKGGPAYEKAVDDMLEMMVELGGAGIAVREQREKMGYGNCTKPDDGDMDEGSEGLLWKDKPEEPKEPKEDK